MHLRLVNGKGGSLLAEHYTRDAGKALEVADKLKAAGLRPNAEKAKNGTPRQREIAEKILKRNPFFKHCS
jgi:hypothetical protein